MLIVLLSKHSSGQPAYDIRRVDFVNIALARKRHFTFNIDPKARSGGEKKGGGEVGQVEQVGRQAAHGQPQHFAQY